MPIEHIFNLEPGFDVRQKLNAAIDIVNNTESTPQDLIDHIADHNSHTNIGPDDHHPQLHDIDSHTDVVAPVPLDGDGLVWNATAQVWEAGAIDGSYVPRSESWPTGLIDGGELNIVNTNDIEVIAGSGVIMDSYTMPGLTPTVTSVSWPLINETITAAPAVAGSVVWFMIDGVGAMAQFAAAPDEIARRDNIFLGVALHNGDTWGEISAPGVINNAAHTVTEFLRRVVGPTFVIDGGTVTEAALFTLDQEAGAVWELNRNWHVDKKNPHREAIPQTTGLQFRYVNRDFTDVGTLISTVDPTQYDNAGTVEAVPGPANAATIQQLYQDPRDNYWILLGQQVFDNATEAAASVAPLTVIPPILGASVLLGYIIVEKAKTDWDADESYLIYPEGAGGAGGGGVPITQYLELADTPSSYSGVKRSVVQVDDTELFSEFDYRTKLLPYVSGQTYYPQETVFQDGWLSSANKVTTDYPAPVGTGVAGFLYAGASPEAPVSVKQVVFGNRYTFGSNGWLTGYRVYTVAGNHYSVFTVRDPLGVPIITQVIDFDATTTGWLDVPTGTALILTGQVFDLIAIASEPDPTPTVFTGNWNYTNPNNPGVPATGQISHANNQLDQLRIHKTDSDAGDRSAQLLALDNGDIVEDDQGTRWSIQNVTDAGTHVTLTIAPAIQSGPIGVRLFTFETVVATPITRMEDVNYWGLSPPGNGTAEGMYIEDGEYGDIVPNTSAYGTDIFIQEATVSPDWDIYGAPGGGGGGGGELEPHVLDFHDDVTIVTPSTGEVLTYNAGQWENLPPLSDHTQLTNIGTNTHAELDTHLADASIHTEATGFTAQVALDQAAYDLLAPPDANTIYFVTP